MQILVGSDRNTCIPIILVVCIKSEISLRVCLIYLHHSYPVVSTRQRTSSLDCYLTLQQLDFRLHSLCITPYQAPHTSHCNRYSLVLYSPSHHFRYHHTLFFFPVTRRDFIRASVGTRDEVVRATKFYFFHKYLLFIFS